MGGLLGNREIYEEIERTPNYSRFGVDSHHRFLAMANVLNGRLSPQAMTSKVKCELTMYVIVLLHTHTYPQKATPIFLSGPGDFSLPQTLTLHENISISHKYFYLLALLY